MYQILICKSSSTFGVLDLNFGNVGDHVYGIWGSSTLVGNLLVGALLVTMAMAMVLELSWVLWCYYGSTGSFGSTVTMDYGYILALEELCYGYGYGCTLLTGSVSTMNMS